MCNCINSNPRSSFCSAISTTQLSSVLFSLSRSMSHSKQFVPTRLAAACFLSPCSLTPFVPVFVSCYHKAAEIQLWLLTFSSSSSFYFSLSTCSLKRGEQKWREKKARQLKGGYERSGDWGRERDWNRASTHEGRIRK